MAKGRKLTTSQSERFLGSYGYGNGHVTYGNDSSELGEEDVWSTVDDMVSDGREDSGEEDCSRMEWSPRAPTEGISMRRERHAGGLSLAFESSGKTAVSPRILHQFQQHRDEVESPPPRGGHHMGTSAPVKVPDWSQIYRVESMQESEESEEGLSEQWEMVPPHEYLARSRRTGTTSVFEGVGRTLKGRDLSRVRDAVWRQTGFDG